MLAEAWDTSSRKPPSLLAPASSALSSGGTAGAGMGCPSPPSLPKFSGNSSPCLEPSRLLPPSPQLGLGWEVLTEHLSWARPPGGKGGSPPSTHPCP